MKKLIKTNLYLCQLIALESKVLQAKHLRTKKLESLDRADLEMIYHSLFALNRQLEALPGEEERRIKYNQALKDDRYIKSFWGSDRSSIAQPQSFT